MHWQQACAYNRASTNTGVYVCNVCCSKYDSKNGYLKHKLTHGHEDGTEALKPVLHIRPVTTFTRM
jgi:hypothetical protein